jgi:hypothetical protein
VTGPVPMWFAFRSFRKAWSSARAGAASQRVIAAAITKVAVATKVARVSMLQTPGGRLCFAT